MIVFTKRKITVDRILSISVSYFLRKSAFIFILLLLFFWGLSSAGYAEIIDNTDPDFSTVGSWGTSSYTSGYYGSNYFFAGPGSGSIQATWSFSVSDGLYELSAQWAAYSNRASNAVYRVYNNGVEIGAQVFDQRFNGGQFNVFDTSYAVDAGILEVVLKDDVDGYVIADAVQILGSGGNIAPNGVIDTPSSDQTILVGDTVNFTGTGTDPEEDPVDLSYHWDFDDSGVSDSTDEDPGLVQFDSVGSYTVTFTVTDSQLLSDPTPATVVVNVQDPGSSLVIVDNTDAGFSTVGSWGTSSYTSGYYDSNYFFAGPGSGSMTATWATNITNPSPYSIYARWTESSNRAPDATYTLSINGIQLGIIQKDQRTDGGQFNLLGTYSLTSGMLEIVLSDCASGFVVADAIQVVNMGINDPLLKIMDPAQLDLKISQDIVVKTFVIGFQPDWEVEFILDGNANNPLNPDFCDIVAEGLVCLNLTGLSLAEHSIEAHMVDGGGVQQNVYDIIDFGIGDYYVAFGDSITEGGNDNFPLDDTSQDLRNTGGGYPPILNDLLTDNKGYPHTVINEGVGGEQSSDALIRVHRMLAAHPDVQRILILFGTNDSSGSMPVMSGVGTGPPDPGTFEYNMQQIIDAINPAETGRIPVLAKVPMRFGDSQDDTPYENPESHPKNLLIEEYNAVIDELENLNPMIEVMTGPPQQSDNFFTYFRDLPRENGIPIEFADNLHPNGVGFQSVARLWCETLTGSPCQ